MPRVSVVIPAYRAKPEQPDYLEETLESVRSQSYGKVEIVIVDDGSRPRSPPHAPTIS